MTEPAIWFLAVRAGTGSDVFTLRLHEALKKQGIRSEVTWLPHRAEYFPWSVSVPEPPAWATIVHVNTWLHRRFVPNQMPLVATMHHNVHDPAMDRYKGVAQRLYHRWWIKPMEAWILRRAARVVAVSRYTASRTRDSFGAVGVRTIHNGLDPRTYPTPRKRGPHHPFRLLFVGSFSRRKGADLLAPIMRALGDDFELRFTNSGGERGCRQPSPSNSISIGRLTDEELLQAYQSSDALILPSRLEGFGQVALEAMACGLPVLATNGSALPEVVEHGVTGWLCPQDDVEAFADASRRLASDQEIWHRMSREAAARAVREFDVSRMVHDYVAMYRSVL